MAPQQVRRAEFSGDDGDEDVEYNRYLIQRGSSLCMRGLANSLVFLWSHQLISLFQPKSKAHGTSLPPSGKASTLRDD